MSTGPLDNDHTTQHALVMRHYASLDAAMNQQRSFESRSLLGELYAAQGLDGLHSAESQLDVQYMLQQDAPIDGLKLIDYGDDLQHWETPLLTSLIDQRSEVAASLIALGAAVDAPNAIRFPNGNGFGHTALHMLIARGERGGAVSLIEAGADLNCQTTEGATPLHFAAMEDDEETIVALLRAGASPRVRNFAGSMPIGLAGPKTRPLLS